MRVFLGEISIRISKLSKVSCSPQSERALSNLLGAWIGQKTVNRGICPCLPILNLPAGVGTSHLLIFSSLGLDFNHCLPWFSGLWTQWITIQLAWVSSLQIADCGISQLLLLCDPIPYNKSLYIYLYIINILLYIIYYI